MSMIWLVGTSDQWLEAVSEVMSGFFGVRRIGSLKNFSRLNTLRETPASSDFICMVRLAPTDDLISIYSAFSCFLKDFKNPDFVAFMTIKNERVTSHTTHHTYTFTCYYYRI